MKRAQNPPVTSELPPAKRLRPSTSEPSSIYRSPVQTSVSKISKSDKEGTGGKSPEASSVRRLLSSRIGMSISSSVQTSVTKSSDTDVKSSSISTLLSSRIGEKLISSPVQTSVPKPCKSDKEKTGVKSVSVSTVSVSTPYSSRIGKSISSPVQTSVPKLGKSGKEKTGLKSPRTEPKSLSIIRAGINARGNEESGSVLGGKLRGVGGACSKPLPLSNGVDINPGGSTAANNVLMEEDIISVTGSSSVNETSSGLWKDSRPKSSKSAIQESGSQMASTGSGGTINFSKLFSYYPSKLVLQDGDLCPQYSLSVSGLERSKLNTLPPTHPFLSWNLGQPTNKPAASAAIKPSRRKVKPKGANNIT